MMRHIIGLDLVAQGETEESHDKGGSSNFPLLSRVDAWRIKVSPIPLDDRLDR